MWNVAEKKMDVSQDWQKGYRRMWQVETDKGQLDLSDSQLGNLLVGVHHAGKSDIIGATFSVKSNGKTGMDIRYYLNPVKVEPVIQVDAPEPTDKEIEAVTDEDQEFLNSIPF